MICILTVEFSTKLRSKIWISPIRRISSIHESHQFWIRIGSFPRPPHPTKMNQRQVRFYSSQWLTIRMKWMEHCRYPNWWRYLFYSHHTKRVVVANLWMSNRAYTVVLRMAEGKNKEQRWKQRFWKTASYLSQKANDKWHDHVCLMNFYKGVLLLFY